MFKCAKWKLWVKKCGRNDRDFKSIDDVTKALMFVSLVTSTCTLTRYLCETNPDPLSYQAFQKSDKSWNKVVYYYLYEN